MGTGFIISGWVLSGGKSYPGRGVEGKHGNSPEVEPGSGWAASGPEGRSCCDGLNRAGRENWRV